MTSERVEHTTLVGSFTDNDHARHATAGRDTARLSGSNLPPKPQLAADERGTSYHKSKTRLGRLPKEKRRSAVLRSVSPGSFTEDRDGRHTPIEATHCGQSWSDGNKENLQHSSPYRSVAKDAAVHSQRYAETSHSRLLTVDASPSASSAWASEPLVASGVFPNSPSGPCIHLTRGGAAVPIHLESLGDSPQEIIALLKTFSGHPSERGQWMIVAAHYRSRGSASAALAVVTAMIEVMRAVGIEECQLKPAMLMLSSCHLDVRKQLRSQAGCETADSKYHFEKGCEGLRRVYGAFVPPSSTPLASSHTQPFCSTTAEIFASTKNDSHHSEQPIPLTEAPRCDDPASTISARFSPQYAKLKILEREVRSLRDRQVDQTETLDRTRAAKRKLEDDLQAERRVRARLERELEQAEADASGAHQGEKHALERCRTEVDTRRRAEVRAEEMQQEAMEVRAALEPKVAEYTKRERTFTDLFGRLGVAFLKAASGDLREVAKAASGESREVLNMNCGRT